MATSFQGFRSLIENSPDAISLIDMHGEILYGSASTARLFGYLPEELVGRNCLDLIHPEDRDHSSRALQTVLGKPSGPLQWDSRLRNKAGSYSWVESTASNFLLEEDIRAIVVHQRDVNARKAAETERRQQAEELAQSNLRLEEFAYTAAHDLREPLRSISLYSDMLAQRAQKDGNSAEIAQFIVDATLRMSTLIDDLLAFATTGMQEPLQRVSLDHVVKLAVKNLDLAIAATGAIVTIEGLPFVQSNELHLVRIFQNLIGNAVKYRSQNPLEIHVTAKRQRADWVVRIVDNGIGIAPEDHARVFQPFLRLAMAGIPGTGLGLAVCKKIVEGLGGKLWVESKLGAGSAFCFTIAATARGTQSHHLTQRLAS